MVTAQRGDGSVQYQKYLHVSQYSADVYPYQPLWVKLRIFNVLADSNHPGLGGISRIFTRFFSIKVDMACLSPVGYGV